MNKIKKYLPSKKFTLIFGSAALLFLALIIFLIFYNKNQDFKNENSGLAIETDITTNQTLQELIQSDKDGDGVQDWEEALWGTDKNKKATFDGKSDSVYIAEKKKELNIETDLNNEKKLNETEIFAREFFSAYAALKSSGQADSETINNFSTALGEKFTEGSLPDIYKNDTVKKTSLDNLSEKTKYYLSIKNAFQKESKYGIGDEIGILSAGVSDYANDGTESKYEKLTIISQAYKNFAEKVISTPVPESLSEIHLKIANNAYNTGLSVENLTKVTSDPLVGIKGLTQYQKYSDGLVASVGELETKISN